MALTQAQAQALIEQSMISGGSTATFDANGGYDAVRQLAMSGGWGGGSPTVGSILKYGTVGNADGSGNGSYTSGGGQLFDPATASEAALAYSKTPEGIKLLQGYDGVAGNNYYDEALKAAALSQDNLGLTLDQVDWSSPAEDTSIGSSYAASAPATPAAPTAHAYRNSYGGGRNRVVDYRQPNMDAAYSADDWLIWDTPTDEPGGSNFNFSQRPAAPNAGATGYGTGGSQQANSVAWDWEADNQLNNYSAPQSWDARAKSRSSSTPWF